MSALIAIHERFHEPQEFISKSGLNVVMTDDVWQLLATPSKGWKFDMSWLWTPLIPSRDRSIILDVFAYYAMTKSPSTTATVVYGSKFHLSSGIPELLSLRGKWSGLPVHQKKALNQFFGTICNLGYRDFNEHHEFTKSHLQKNRIKVFDSRKGALSEEEYDNFCVHLNSIVRKIDWHKVRPLKYFTHKHKFSSVKNSVSARLLMATVRRPIQVCSLKWCDLIPAGAKFNDLDINISCEVGSIGNNHLQLRVFHAKGAGRSWRETPERYPIPLSAQMSEILINYKALYLQGVRRLLEEGECKLSHQELVNAVSNMPMFISANFFDMKIASKSELEALFSYKSRALHLDESSLTKYLTQIQVKSSRASDCTVSSNRIRHTVLTRGAQKGLSATILAKITGVTVPGARHYVDIDYKSRLMIDDLYIGSDFLASIFSDPLEDVSEDDEKVVDQDFSVVGGLRVKNDCIKCPVSMGRPVGCYGCNNFRPILEADHRKVLDFAELKLAANKDQVLSPDETLSVERLEKQIRWIKLTINVCDQVLEARRGIE